MSDLVQEPGWRQLRIFAFDPAISGQFDTSGIAEIKIDVTWEKNLQPGPIGEYLEVIDADPASGVFYKPVHLNDIRILAQSGLAPSESNPQFHQQMVYAVAMTTIRHFEQALGRVALWSSYRSGRKSTFVRRLRIYPHALRDRNAFYSPDKKALLFGYFPVDIKDANNTPGTIVFTCLSHDIIAHETTHALLDGAHPRFSEPVNRDVLAFHEAFADVVALFQHFSYPGVLRDQIARTRGDLTNENLLGQLAQQFGRASGTGHALRDALGALDKATGKWRPYEPDVHALETATEPHDRGAILVAAIFGAFLKVYRARVMDLYRIASEGTGVLREGAIHPDLANRLANEAASTAQNVLQMCIRAIDYCPPVGITFGDYLRAIVTADKELNPDDPFGNRLAMVESFRQWGIQPEGMKSMSVQSLLWPTLEEFADATGAASTNETKETVASLFTSRWEESPDDPQEEDFFGLDPKQSREFTSWNLEGDRLGIWKKVQVNALAIWNWLMKGKGRSIARTVGLVVDATNAPKTIFCSPKIPNTLAVEVHSVKTSLRRSARGGVVPDIVVEITQRRRGFFSKQKQKQMDAQGDSNDENDFIFRAGCTLVINPENREVRRVIPTAGSIIDDAQLERVRRFLAGDGSEQSNAFFNPHSPLLTNEPFAMLHRGEE